MRDADRQQRGDGNIPALIERNEKQIGEQNREPEDNPGLSARRLFLKRGSGPFEA